MIEYLVNAFGSLPKELTVFLISMLPVSELRGAIPAGFMMGVDPVKTFFIAVAGNLAPVIPILLFLEPISNGLMRFKPWKRFFDWLKLCQRGLCDHPGRGPGV